MLTTCQACGDRDPPLRFHSSRDLWLCGLCSTLSDIQEGSTRGALRSADREALIVHLREVNEWVNAARLVRERLEGAQTQTRP